MFVPAVISLLCVYMVGQHINMYDHKNFILLKFEIFQYIFITISILFVNSRKSKSFCK